MKPHFEEELSFNHTKETLLNQVSIKMIATQVVNCLIILLYLQKHSDTQRKQTTLLILLMEIFRLSKEVMCT